MVDSLARALLWFPDWVAAVRCATEATEEEPPFLNVYFSTVHPRLIVLPYVYGLLRSYAEQDPLIRSSFEFAEPFFLPEPTDSLMSKIRDPAVFCVSCYVWNFQRHMQLCERVKAEYPDCVTVAGGPHVPENPGDFFERFPHIDVLIHGEGEVPFANLLRELAKPDPDLGRADGLVINRDGRPHATKSSPRLGKEIEAPSPYLLGYFDDMIEHLRSGELRVKGLRGDYWAPWETVRGCPYACSFCDWGSATMSKIRTFDMDRCAREIEYFAEKGVEEVLCADANFGILERDQVLTEHLVAVKREHGYPKAIRVNFAKNSNERVLEMSRSLHGARMLWGTTLSVQSASEPVLEAVKRANISGGIYSELKDKYDLAQIPTYSDVILGLPEETRESWMSGMCELFRNGQHDDIRLAELTLLPNAPINQPSQRERYGLRTVWKHLYEVSEALGDAVERAEIVVATNTMSREEWIECYAFTELMAIALHNGAYTRFLAIYLDATDALSYDDFYIGLFNRHRSQPHTLLGRIIARYVGLLSRYIEDETVTQWRKGTSDPEIGPFMRTYFGSDKAWNLYNWAWLVLSENRGQLEAEVLSHLVDSNVTVNDRRFVDLLRFQTDIVVTLDYDPDTGKQAIYDHDWPRYFFGDRVLQQDRCRVQFGDRALGLDDRFVLERGNRALFARAATGQTFPMSRFRHFHHQRDRMTVQTLETEPVAELGAAVI